MSNTSLVKCLTVKMRGLSHLIRPFFPELPPTKASKKIKRLDTGYVLTTQQLEGRKINVINYFLKNNSPNIY